MSGSGGQPDDGVAPIERLVAAYEALRPDTLERLLDCYAEQARFRDPFNDLRGREAIRAVFDHMFATLDSPRFAVTGRFGDGDEIVLRWVFRFGTGGGERSIEGLSTLRFDSAGRIVEHLDYWDPAAGIYEHLPWVGRLFSALRRRLAAPGAGRTP